MVFCHCNWILNTHLIRNSSQYGAVYSSLSPDRFWRHPSHLCGKSMLLMMMLMMMLMLCELMLLGLIFSPPRQSRGGTHGQQRRPGRSSSPAGHHSAGTPNLIHSIPFRDRGRVRHGSAPFANCHRAQQIVGGGLTECSAAHCNSSQQIGRLMRGFRHQHISTAEGITHTDHVVVITHARSPSHRDRSKGIGRLMHDHVSRKIGGLVYIDHYRWAGAHPAFPRRICFGLIQCSFCGRRQQLLSRRLLRRNPPTSLMPMVGCIICWGHTIPFGFAPPAAATNVTPFTMDADDGCITIICCNICKKDAGRFCWC
mmetsp:Transcript_6857/g.16882  ORF Transcript_6857/g.16882 Transcript_6857/m.16882 type:complete len:312 (+) Transcript_6857:1046-1981(+)